MSKTKKAACFVCGAKCEPYAAMCGECHDDFVQTRQGVESGPDARTFAFLDAVRWTVKRLKDQVCSADVCPTCGR